jgi:Ribonuclease G/E
VITTAFLDEAVGETRVVMLDEVGRPAALRFERASQRGRFAAAGEIYYGRLIRIEERLGGGFVDLGVGPEGFLPFKDGAIPAGLHEGSAVKVEVAAEAAPGKGPRLRRLPDATESGDAPRLISSPPPLAAEFPRAVRGPDARRAVDASVELALALQVAIAGGGSISIEQTRALVAIDVDSGARTAPSPELLSRATNEAAIDAAARHISLRSLSGIVVLDLMTLHHKNDRDALRARMAGKLKMLGVKAEVGLISRLGLLEVAVTRRRRSIREVMLDPLSGLPTAETVALDALRRLEDEALADRGARLKLSAPADAVAWLEGDEGRAIAWRKALTDRIGARFELETHPRGQIEVGPP